MVNALVTVTEKSRLKPQNRKPVLRIHSTHDTLQEAYDEMVKQTTHYVMQGFSVSINVAGYKTLSDLKLAIPCSSCGKPHRNHLDQWGMYKPCKVTKQ